MTFPDKHSEELSKEIDSIMVLLRAIKETLKAARTEKEFPNDDEQNVVYVDFALKKEFEKAQTIPLKPSQIVAVYHDWAYRTYELIQANIHNLNNKAVREMVELNYAIVNTIENLLPRLKK